MLVGELGTVSCVSGSCNSVNLKPLCDSNESLSHNFGPESSTCVADVCFYVPNLDDSVVSDCSDAHVRTGDTRPASCTLGYVLGVGDTKQTFFCLPEGILSGTQPVCEPLPFSAPKIDSGSVVDVCIDRAEEGSCVVSCARGSHIEGDPAVWTCMTNDSLIDDGPPRASRRRAPRSDRKGTLPSQTGTESCVSGYVASDMCDAVFQYLAPPGVPDGTLPRDVPLVCPGQEFDGSEGIAHTYDGGGLGDNCGEESAYGADETYTCVWNDSTLPQIHHPLTRPSECSLASVLPASTGQDGDGLAFQEEGTATRTESYEAKSRVIASTTQTCHLDVYAFADTGWQFPICVTTTVLQCSTSTLAPQKKKSSTRSIAQIRLSAGLASWVALLAPSLLPETILLRLPVLARTTALLFSLGTCPRAK